MVTPAQTALLDVVPNWIKLKNHPSHLECSYEDGSKCISPQG